MSRTWCGECSIARISVPVSVPDLRQHLHVPLSRTQNTTGHLQGEGVLHRYDIAKQLRSDSRRYIVSNYRARDVYATGCAAGAADAVETGFVGIGAGGCGHVEAVAGYGCAGNSCEVLDLPRPGRGGRGGGGGGRENGDDGGFGEHVGYGLDGARR
jgi:hypothetical protein